MQARGQRRLGLACLRGIDQIELGDQDVIGERNLMHRLDMLVERVGAIHGIHGRHHGADAIEPGERRVGQEGLV